MDIVGQMTIEERAAREYCKIKGIDPDKYSYLSNYHNRNIDMYLSEFQELSLKLYCLKQAESTK